MQYILGKQASGRRNANPLSALKYCHFPSEALSLFVLYIIEQKMIFIGYTSAWAQFPLSTQPEKQYGTINKMRSP